MDIGRGAQGDHFLICIKIEPRRPSILTAKRNRRVDRMGIMLSDSRHWLEYDPVALAVLLIGIGSVALIVLTI
jgi:hypothetical protein